MNGIAQQIVSFLSSFKVFFFHTLAFVIFGSAFLFLSQSFCENGWLCNYLMPATIDFGFGGRVDVIKFLIFSYIVGLLLYAFSHLVFSKSFRGFLDKHYFKKKEKEGNKKQPNDIQIFAYLENHPLSRDVYLMQLFYSLIVRLLFGLAIISTLFFSPALLLLGIVISIALFFLNISADNEVKNLGSQIQEVITENNLVNT